MKRIDSFKKELTTEDVIIFMRWGFKCIDCPANGVCEHLKNDSGKKMCKDYQKISDFLEEEI